MTVIKKTFGLCEFLWDTIQNDFFKIVSNGYVS